MIFRRSPHVPPELHAAAVRGRIRTTAQAYAATLTTGLPTAAVIMAVIEDPSAWIPTALTVILALVSPVLAGLASYLSIIGAGLPAEYVEAAVEDVVRQDEATATIVVPPAE